MRVMISPDETAALAEGAEDRPKRRLPPAGQRALAEAAERRAARERDAVKPPAEQGGRRGLDPVRYGDWEIKGLASDF